jgi:hypothetical protein
MLHDLVIEGESYPRLKHEFMGNEQPPVVPVTKPDRPIRRRKRRAGYVGACGAPRVTARAEVGMLTPRSLDHPLVP